VEEVAEHASLEVLNDLDSSTPRCIVMMLFSTGEIGVIGGERERENEID
jgi:hypothetical protein